MTGQYAQQQKMLLYVLPVVFAVGGIAFPIGVLFYWTTSNLWTMGQQFYVIRNNPAPGTPAFEGQAGARRAPRRRSTGTAAPRGADDHRGRGSRPRRPRQQPKQQSRSSARSSRRQRQARAPAADERPHHRRGRPHERDRADAETPSRPSRRADRGHRATPRTADA